MINQYTMTLKEIIENKINIFDFDYPIFNEDYRKILEDKIIKHYYFYEIGTETVGKFKFYLREKMNLIMPYYNKLYESELIKYDPLINYKIEDQYTKDLNGSGESTNNTNNSTTSNSNNTSNKTQQTTNDQLNKFSDTPMGENDPFENRYFTNITQDNGSSTLNDRDESQLDQNIKSTNDSTVNTRTENNERFNKTTVGNRGQDPSKMLQEYRKTFLNIDEQIVEECKDLFMLIF